MYYYVCFKHGFFFLSIIIGEHVYDCPIELHDQQLSQPEYRFFECLKEEEQAKQTAAFTLTEENIKASRLQKRTLPVLALNEVYLGECVSARVSYFEMTTDTSNPPGERIKTRNAGICISTGTGSTSWSHNINKISHQNVTEILQIVESQLKAELGKNSNPVLHQVSTGSESKGSLSNTGLVDKATDIFNTKLTFPPDSNQMLYTIRDPVSHSMLPCASELTPRAYASRMEIKSRCFDACMVIDGGLSFSFNDGTTAIFEMFEEDSLKTVADFLDDHQDDVNSSRFRMFGNARKDRIN